jgi:hypothetical protein
MKSNFKRLGLATAVSAVAAGYAGMVDAQVARSIGNLGDSAIIPYYTVQDNWVTGVHIINSSDATQVVKLRLRRASDSADALDFNLILSPKDEWTGFIDDSSGTVVFATDDNSCTAPIRADGRFPMPGIFAEGAEEGYIEVVGMGQPVNEAEPIAISAKHTDEGVPRNCSAVASNFFSNTSLNPAGVNDPTEKGNINFEIAHQEASQAEVTAFLAANPAQVCLDSSGAVITTVPGVGAVSGGVCQNNFVSTDNVLKVSYFFRDATAGTEMGGDAVHLSDFSDEAWMTNQEFGLFSGDVFGFDYPDLDGGPWVGFDGGATLRNQFDGLRAGDILGVLEVLNDWSVAAARNVSTDWVVTMPGQYTMIDYFVWLQAGLDPDNCGVDDDGDLTPLCDFRDIPVVADLTLYDREEQEILPEDGDLVISPAPPGQINQLIFPNEVNVVEWTDGSTAPVLESEYAITVDPTVLGDFGWAELSVESGSKDGGQRVCQWSVTANNSGSPTSPNFTTDDVRSSVCSSVSNSNVPITGFVAWQRSFPSNPDANYGRLIDHSFVTSN